MNRIFQRGIKLSSIVKGIGDVDWNHINVTYKANSFCFFDFSKEQFDQSSLERAKKLIQQEQREDVFHSAPLSSFLINLQPGSDFASIISAQGLAAAEKMMEKGKILSYVNCRFTGIVDPTRPMEYHLHRDYPDFGKTKDNLFIRGIQNDKKVLKLQANYEVNTRFEYFRMPLTHQTTASRLSLDSPIITIRGKSPTEYNLKGAINQYQRDGYGKYALTYGPDGEPDATIEFEKDEDDMFDDTPKTYITRWDHLGNVQDNVRKMKQELDRGLLGTRLCKTQAEREQAYAADLSAMAKLPANMADRIREHIHKNYDENSLIEVRPANSYVHFNMFIAHGKKHFPIYQWIRFNGGGPENNEALQRILLMYSMNMPSYETVSKPHFWDMKEEMYTIDQHFQMFRPLTEYDQWLLLGACSSRGENKGRDYAGRVWSQDGELIAKCMVHKVPMTVIANAPEGKIENDDKAESE